MYKVFHLNQWEYKGEKGETSYWRNYFGLGLNRFSIGLHHFGSQGLHTRLNIGFIQFAWGYIKVDPKTKNLIFSV